MLEQVLHEVVDRRSVTLAPTNPSTSHKVDTNVTRQRTLEKREQPKVHQESPYMVNALSRFGSLYDKCERSQMKKMQKFETFRIQVVAEATKATLESQESVAKMNIDAQERTTQARIEAEKMVQQQRIELKMLMETRCEEF